VKKRRLERELRRLGWWRAHGGKHDKWTNGTFSVAVPRHAEINEYTARAILIEVTELNAKTGDQK
jgi:hypothetical protein